MSILNKIYRRISEFKEGVRSSFRILHFKFKYPSLKINSASHLSRNAEVICCDGSVCELKNVFIAKNVYIKVEQGAILKISDSYIGANTIIVANECIEINSNCSIGEMVVIRDQNHMYGNSKLIKDSGYKTGKITIGKNVWLGAKCTILKGVQLGDNTVVGAHSLVNKSFQANSVVIGIPAKLMVKK